MSEVGTQYFLGETEVVNSYLGDMSVLVNPFSSFPYPITTNGLIMFLDGTQNVDTASGYWYSSYGSGNVTASLFGSPTWNSSNGVFSFTHQQGLETVPFPGPIDLRYTDEYTVIYTTRYTGTEADKHGRTLVSQVPPGAAFNNLLYNWTLGMYSGSYAGLPDTGPAYFAPDPNSAHWIFEPSGSYDTNWRVFAASATYTDVPGVQDPRTQNFYLNGAYITSSTTSSVYPAGPYGLGVNTGSFCDGTVGSSTRENSNCEISDILVYNRVLSNDEITEVYAFLANRVGI